MIKLRFLDTGITEPDKVRLATGRHVVTIDKVTLSKETYFINCTYRGKRLQVQPRCNLSPTNDFLVMDQLRMRSFVEALLGEGATAREAEALVSQDNAPQLRGVQIGLDVTLREKYVLYTFLPVSAVRPV